MSKQFPTYEWLKDGWLQMQAERDRLREAMKVSQDIGDRENARLRAALERIAADEAPHDHGMWFHEIAREALAGASDSQQTPDISDGKA